MKEENLKQRVGKIQLRWELEKLEKKNLDWEKKAHGKQMRTSGDIQTITRRRTML